MRFKDRPSILGNNTRIQIVVVIPAIATAVAVYMALFFVNRVLSRYQEDAGWGGHDAKAEEGEVLVRDIGGVVEKPVVFDRTPPPAPEAVRREIYRERDEALRAAIEAEKPVLMPVLEPEPIELENITLEPLAIPETTADALRETLNVEGVSQNAGQ